MSNLQSSNFKSTESMAVRSALKSESIKFHSRIAKYRNTPLVNVHSVLS